MQIIYEPSRSYINQGLFVKFVKRLQFVQQFRIDLK